MTAGQRERGLPAGGRGAGMGLGRPAVVLSIVFHVVGFFVIVGVPRLLASGPDMGKVYVVDLVTLPGPAGPGPATPAPPAAAAAPKAEAPKAAAAPKPPPVKKPVEKAIVLPDRNAKKPPVKPQPVKSKEKEQPPVREDTAAKEPAATAAEPAATEATPNAAPTTAAGVLPAGTTAVAGQGAGGEGDGTGGGGDAYTFYLALLKRNIESAWKRPVYTGTTTLSATVNLKLSRAGRVQRLELSRASGFEPLDRSLMVAVRAAEPFPPFPVALAMDTLAVQIVFDLTPEGSEPGNPGE